MSKYKILVIDDESMMRESFKLYELLLSKQSIDAKFFIASDINEYDLMKSQEFDILMVDYNLKNGFYDDSKKSEGTEFIADFRKNNMVNKIIFYSTDFTYSGATINGTYNLNISPKDYFDLINKYKIDGIIPKGETKMLMEKIIDCIENLDPIIKFLREAKERYESDTAKLYYEVNGKSYTISQLLKEYQMETSVGKKFGIDILKNISTLLLDYRY